MKLIGDGTWSYDEETTRPHVLEAGTSGAFLRSQGGGATPQWAQPASGLGTKKILYDTSATVFKEDPITPPEVDQAGEPA